MQHPRLAAVAAVVLLTVAVTGFFFLRMQRQAERDGHAAPATASPSPFSVTGGAAVDRPEARLTEVTGTVSNASSVPRDVLVTVIFYDAQGAPVYAAAYVVRTLPAATSEPFALQTSDLVTGYARVSFSAQGI